MSFSSAGGRNQASKQIQPQLGVNIMLTQTQQVDLTLHHLKERALAEYSPQQRATVEASEDWKQFDRRLNEHFPKLMHELDNVYNDNEAVLPMLEQLIAQAWQSYSQRDKSLKAIDAARESDPDWILSNKQVGGVCYVDLFAGDLKGLKAKIPYFQELGLTYLHMMPLFKCPEGKSDGGYAVSSYRDVNPALGTIDDLRDVIAALHEAGISAVVDFIFNHTSNEHEWAKGCSAGDPLYDNFYYIFPDRWMPDQYDRTLREIFPDQHPGGFSQLEDGRWVWTTFNSFQWDLNYSNPWVFRAMAGEMMFLANLGVDILRMDAVAFIWKQMGTCCENLPQAHALIRAFNAVMRIAAPAVFFKSEAIVHPDQVVQYIGQDECQIGYNPLQMALLWNTLATREVNLLHQTLSYRHNLPDHTAWVNYVRSHDDIGWTFADEDASQFGIHGYDHRQFLNRFFVNHFDGSFARGVPFQYNPNTGAHASSPHHNFSIRSIQGDLTPESRLPTSGSIRYQGHAFSGLDDRGPNGHLNSRLDYTVDFGNRTGSGSITGLSRFGNIELAAGRLDRSRSALESTAISQQRGRGHYELNIFGPNADEIAGKATGFTGSNHEVGFSGSKTQQNP